MFIIIGVLIISISIFLINFNSNPDDIVVGESLSGSILEGDGENVFNYIEDCFGLVASKSLFELGNQGLYFDFPENFESFEDGFSPYYIYDERILIPSTTDIELSFSKLLDKNFNYCILGLNESFAEIYELTFEDYSSKVNILSDKINLNLNFPLGVKISDKNVQLSKFNYDLNFNLLEKIDLVKFYLDEQVKDVSYFNIGFLTQYAYENDFKFDINYLPGDLIFITFIFDDYSLSKDNEKFKYSFLVQFDWSDLE